jgi:hypothetical protein
MRVGEVTQMHEASDPGALSSLVGQPVVQDRLIIKSSTFSHVDAPTG